MPCGVWDLCSPARDGMNLCPLHWKHGVLTTRPPGRSQCILTLNLLNKLWSRYCYSSHNTNKGTETQKDEGLAQVNPVCQRRRLDLPPGSLVSECRPSAPAQHDIYIQSWELSMTMSLKVQVVGWWVIQHIIFFTMIKTGMVWSFMQMWNLKEIFSVWWIVLGCSLGSPRGLYFLSSMSGACSLGKHLRGIMCDFSMPGFRYPALKLEVRGQMLGADSRISAILEKGMAIHSSILAWRIPKNRGAWWAIVHGVTKELDTTEQLTLSLSGPPSSLLAVWKVGTGKR